MHVQKIKFGRSLALWVLLTVGATVAGCQSSAAVTQSGSGTALPNPPAVVQATLTAGSNMVGKQGVATATTNAVSGKASPTSVTGGTVGSGSLPDSSIWTKVQQSSAGVTYSYSYPPGWKESLSYCVTGANTGSAGGDLPAGCVSTDLLVGAKAQSMGQIAGDALTISGLHAIKQVEASPRSGLASAIYTLLVYSDAGAPLFGFASSIGRGTDAATQQAITATLDQIASTIAITSQP